MTALNRTGALGQSKTCLDPRFTVCGLRGFPIVRVTAILIVSLASVLIMSALAEEVTGGRTNAFAGDGPGKDLYGDPLPERALLRLGTSRLRHDTDICCIAFSPDDRRLATGSSGAIVFWDPTTGKKIGEIPAPEFKRTSTLEFSPDGTQVALGAANFLRVWRVADGEPVFAQTHPHGKVRGVAFVSDGRTLASIGGDGQVRLWDIAEGKEQGALESGFAGNGRILRLAASPDGRRLAAASDTSICIWDVDSGKRLASINDAHSSAVRSLVFSADGRTLISNGVYSVEAPGADPPSRARGTFSQIRRWDAQTGELIGDLLTGDTDLIADIAPTLDGERLLATTTRNLLELDLESGRLVRRIQLPNRWINNHDMTAVSPDGKTLGLVSGNKGVHLVDLATGDLCFPAPMEATLTVAYSPDGSRIVTASQDGTVRLWNAWTGRHLLLLDDVAGFTNLLAVAFSPDGSLVAACGDYSRPPPVGMVGVVKVWNARSGELLYQQFADGHLLGMLAFSGDGTMLAAADGFGRLLGNRTVPPQICVFRTESGERLLTLPSHSKSIAAMAFTRDNSSLIGVGGGMVGGQDARIWSLPAGKLKKTIATDPLTAAAISRDAAILLTCVHREEDAILSAMDLASGTIVRQFDLSLCKSRTRVPSPPMLDISHDGQSLAAGCAEGPISIWDLETGRRLCEIRAPEKGFCSVAFAPWSDRVVTGMNDGTALVWDISEDLAYRGKRP